MNSSFSGLTLEILTDTISSGIVDIISSDALYFESHNCPPDTNIEFRIQSKSDRTDEFFFGTFEQLAGAWDLKKLPAGMLHVLRLFKKYIKRPSPLSTRYRAISFPTVTSRITE